MTEQHGRNLQSPRTPAAAWLPWFVTGIVACTIWAFHLQFIAEGGFHLYDEFHTLDRASAFARHDSWFTVHSMQEASFRKPPLQYWTTAGLLGTGIDPIVALRLPSMLFALAALGSVALLTAAIVPRNGWAMPGAVLLFASSSEFWEHALSGMLDVGAVFFSTLALAAAILALRRPGWWYVAAASIVLGAMQKAPVGLVLVALFLALLSATRRWHGMGFASIRAQRAFRIAAWIAILGTVAWPVAQSLMHQTNALEEFLGKQVVQRFVPTDRIEEIRGVHTLVELIIGNEPVLRWAGIVALAWLPVRLSRPELLPLPGLFAIYAIGMMLAGGHVTPRYTLVFLPLLAAALSVVILSLARRAWVGAGLTVAVVLASGGPIHDSDGLGLETLPEFARQIEAASHLGGMLEPSETLVICTTGGPDRLVPALVSHFAAHGRPFVQLDGVAGSVDRRDGGDRLDGPLRGLCRTDEIDDLASRLDDFAIVETLEEHVAWTARGRRGRPDSEGSGRGSN